MIEISLLIHIVLRYVKKAVHYFRSKKGKIGEHLTQLGTAAYTGSFVLCIQESNGLTFDVINLYFCGLLVANLGEQLKR
ncbi:hypothetical protein SAMN04488136_13011 [Vibrio xiamenensis]|uniref:Uncharacterized protein n=1 Tax=Vibrio xiamenensis TaxID=861298 RepID=A0A1G8FE02_9VIBR|nr:hypothetical protein [Vibrio xiamenensis]SDH80326.1 hypothetical protein SAMN04488136_13011 [Vibrio xiamenensis]